MSKTGGTSTSTSTTAPPSFQMPYLEQMFSEAKGLYGSEGPQYYPGTMTAGFTPTEQQGQQAITNYATGGAQDIANQAANAFKFGTSDVLNVAGNPYLSDVAKAITDQNWRGLSENYLPNVRAQFAQGGTLGSSRQGIAEAQGAERTARSTAEALTSLYGNAYGQGLQTFQSTLPQATAVQAAGTVPGTLLSGVGAQERTLEQARLNEDVARFSYNQNLPYVKLAEYANLIRGPFGGEATSVNIAPETGTAEQVTSAGLSLLPFIGELMKIFNP